jgi:ribosome maturation factor RimP
LDSKNISRYVEDYLKANSWDDCFIVDVHTSPSGKIEVYLDCDTGISYEKCRKVSRHIESIIDETKEFGEKYTLEVSSPGLSRPLKFFRQYAKNIGRKVVIKTDSKTFKGIMKDVNEEFLILEQSKAIKKGSKKKVTIETKIDMKEILETKIAVSF